MSDKFTDGQKRILASKGFDTGYPSQRSVAVIEQGVRVEVRPEGDRLCLSIDLPGALQMLNVVIPRDDLFNLPMAPNEPNEENV